MELWLKLSMRQILKIILDLSSGRVGAQKIKTLTVEFSKHAFQSYGAQKFQVILSSEKIFTPQQLVVEYVSSLSVDTIKLFAAVCLTPPNSHYCLSSIAVSDTAARTFFTSCSTNKENIISPRSSQLLSVKACDSP